MPNYIAELAIPDQEIPVVLTTMFLVFQTGDPESSMHALHKGVEKTVSQLPFLAGCVWEDASDGHKMKISWSDDGPQVVPFDKLSGDDLPGYDELNVQGMPFHTLTHHDFIGPNLRSLMQANKKPAIYVAYTVIRGGLIFLLSLHHSLFDGCGFEMVQNLIALNVQGLSTKSYKIDPLEPMRRASRLSDIIARMAISKDTLDVPKSSFPPSIRTDIGQVSSVQKLLLRFSNNKLKALRKELRHYTESSFSISTMVLTLLWVLDIAARLSASKKDPRLFNSFKGKDSLLYMAYNLRSFCEKAGQLEKNSWLGNMIAYMEPFPKLACDDVATMEQKMIELRLNGQAVLCPRLIPETIENLTQQIRSLSPEPALSRWGTFQSTTNVPDYRQLRDMSFFFHGPNLIGANNSSFSLPDFGPGLGGYPTHIRTLGSSLQGFLFSYARHRDLRCDPELLDRIDLIITVSSENANMIQDNPILNAVFV